MTWRCLWLPMVTTLRADDAVVTWSPWLHQNGRIGGHCIPKFPGGLSEDRQTPTGMGRPWLCPRLQPLPLWVWPQEGRGFLPTPSLVPNRTLVGSLDLSGQKSHGLAWPHLLGSPVLTPIRCGAPLSSPVLQSPGAAAS